MLTNPDDYFPCFADYERELTRWVFSTTVIIYDKFIAQAVIDTFKAARPDNFEGRAEKWLEMFGYYPFEFQLPNGQWVSGWLSNFNWYLRWALYPPVSEGDTPIECKQRTYSD